MWEGGDPNAAIDVAVLLESAGIDTIVAVDHVVMGTRTDRYVWGPFPFPAGSPWVEPLTLLTAIAARTSRIRLATGILIAGLRPAALLAKTAASVDAISRGRLELGVGVGWQPEEYSAVGVDFSRRGEVLTDTIGACRSLWGPNPCEFAVGERGRRPPQRHMAKPHVHKKPKHLRDGLNRDTHEASLTRDLQSRRKILCRTGMNLPKREAQRTRFERSRP